MQRPVRPFLKWAGGKSELATHIAERLPTARVLIEPFVGSGAVFLNTEYERYILSDINADLINVYTTLQNKGAAYIADARAYFNQKANKESRYYRLRETFNKSNDSYERALLFLYLNRHGYNGLCRYNRGGGFNVPFGQYKAPYFPEDELHHFYLKARKAKFYCEDFKRTFSRARRGHVIYCDPPYVPLTSTAKFSNYSAGGFGPEDQEALASAAARVASRGIPVLISNHDTDVTRELYSEAHLSYFDVRRSISCNGAKRAKARELMALFHNSEENDGSVQN